MTGRGHRGGVALRGLADETLAAARGLVADLAPDEVIWLASAADARQRLGTSASAVVLDLYDGVDADQLARAHGFVRGGGSLILRLPHDLRAVPRSALAVHPFGPEDVGTRTADRIERALGSLPPPTVDAAPWVPRATPDQDAVVGALGRAWASAHPSRTAILADRGRGKSAALGRALAGVGDRSFAVAALDDEGMGSIERFAGRPVTRVEPLALAIGPERPEIVVIDEAARIPVPLLRAIHERHADAHQVWASTTGGYEGTGRGFVLRFLAEMSDSCERLAMSTPIRWGPDDPLEAWVRQVLLLDAEPADPPTTSDDLRVTTLDRDALATDEDRLSQVLGLLVHAHYRTTPADLERLLDAPNLEVHAALRADTVVGVCLTALEGGLDHDDCDALLRGRRRIRGHALPETLIAHSGRLHAGSMAMIRSVRIATHPSMRRQGVARALVEHVHARYDPDLFGTLFGATPELLRFRRALGYALVRVGVSRGDRTGERAAVMLRAGSPAGQALIDGLREDLARDLPAQQGLRAAEGEPPEPELDAELAVGLGAGALLTPERIREAVVAYARGPRPYDVAVVWITAFVMMHMTNLRLLTPEERGLVVGRVLRRQGWRALAEQTGHPSVPAVMRALRRAVAALLDVVERS